MSRKQQTQSPLQRIKRVLNFYYNRGVNSERVNSVYKRILKERGAI